MKNGKRFVGMSVVLGLIMLAVLFSALNVNARNAQAAPDLVTTPVSYPNRISDDSVRYPLSFFASEVFSASMRGTTFSLPGYSILDLQYIIDQGASPNTVTLKLQNSCDGVHWVDQGTLVANNAADASNIVQLNTFCRYANIYATVTNTRTLTLTVIGVAK